MSARAGVVPAPAAIPYPRWVGIGGIALGVIAFWVSLPPLAERSIAYSIVLGLLAAAAGLYAVAGGMWRVGWGAVMSAVIGISGGILATQSSVTHLETVVTERGAHTTAWNAATRELYVFQPHSSGAAVYVDE